MSPYNGGLKKYLTICLHTMVVSKSGELSEGNYVARNSVASTDAFLQLTTQASGLAATVQAQYRPGPVQAFGAGLRLPYFLCDSL